MHLCMRIMYTRYCQVFVRVSRGRTRLTYLRVGENAKFQLTNKVIVVGFEYVCIRSIVHFSHDDFRECFGRLALQKTIMVRLFTRISSVL